MKGGKEGERSNYVLRTWKRNRKRKKARPLLPSLHARKSEITTFSSVILRREGGGGGCLLTFLSCARQKFLFDPPLVGGGGGPSLVC